MLFSEKYNYIYIAIPKTGSRSIQKFLTENDNSSVLNKVKVNNDLMNVGERDEAKKVKEVMGDAFDNYYSFAFIRHPYSKIVSSYFFFKNGEPLHENTFANFIRAGLGRKIQLITTNLKILSAKILPFHIWGLIYPYKSNLDYVTDSKGNIIVKYIGIYETLGDNFSTALQKISIPLNEAELPHLNRSAHKEYDQYFRNQTFKKLIDNKVKEDLNFYFETISKQ